MYVCVRAGPVAGTAMAVPIFEGENMMVSLEFHMHILPQRSS